MNHVIETITELLRDAYHARPDILKVEDGVLRLRVRNLDEAESRNLVEQLGAIGGTVGGKHEENAKSEGEAYTVRAVIDLRHLAAAK